MISPLIKWDHSESWCVAKWDRNANLSQKIIEVNAGSDESPDNYMLDHCIDGICLYPATGYLVLVWKALAEIKGKDVLSLPVTFEEVKIHRATVLSKEVSTKFLIDITNAGEFEISEGGITLCTGRIYSQEESAKTDASELLRRKDLKSLSLKQSDIYKELKLRGYDYGPSLQGLVRADLEGNKGLLKWTGEWVVYLDTMLHISILSSPKPALCLPTRIQNRNMKINPILHKTVMNSALKEYNGVPVFHDKNTKRIISGGVQLKHLKTNFAPRHRNKQIPVLEEYRFIPYNKSNILSKSDAETVGRYIHVCSLLAQMMLELSGKNKDQISDIKKGFKEADELIASYLKSYTNSHALLKSLCGIINSEPRKDSKVLARYAKNYVKSYLSERNNDIISQTMLQETPLRTVMDVVFVNAASRRLKILEIAETSVPFSTKISEFAQNLGVLNVNNLIVHSTPDILEKKRTRLVLAERILSAAANTVLPIHTESDLEQIFKDLNLQVICKKSDSLTSTMYLLRKSADIPYENIVIPVIEDKYEKWVDDLSEQITMASMSSDPKRIWLVSEASNSGIIGLVNCLRQEPGG
ncbi:Fatty acid synthase [Araneus ventricosus]|uniref:Fatty acid synthase n=1 Tax=Araneus ventricosus TaxID=182803 RepID=A0A4Y2FBI5_ARAVE|nr:Fatty acid synthase [Araneus ventricosus]